MGNREELGENKTPSFRIRRHWSDGYFWFDDYLGLTITFALLTCLTAFCPDVRAQFSFDISRKVDAAVFPYDLAIGDFDNNGFKDMAYITAPDGMVHVLFNNGTYKYTTFSTEAGGVSYYYRLSAADFDEDGKSDLAVVTRNNPSNQRLTILISTGTSFTKSNFSIPGPPEIYSISTDDFDNDGHADVLVPNVGQALTWYKGDGLGGFSQQTDNTIIGGNSLVVAEFNNDSRKDLAIGSGQQLDIYLSSGATFTKATLNLGTRPGYLIATDINNDNSEDIVGTFSNPVVYIAGITNNGAGVFSNLVIIPSSTSVSEYLASADYDGDGLQDLAIASYDGRGPVFRLNTGGAFASDPFSDERVNDIKCLAFVDLDNDGSPELVCLSSFPSLSILKRVNNGFQLEHKEILGNIPSQGLSRDVDHDGKFDLINASLSNGAVTIKRGNGDMTFGSNTYLLGAGYRIEYVETADFNSDGYDDILFTEVYLSGNLNIKLSLTDSQGNYQSPILVTQTSSLVITRGDYNLDGKQDFFCADGIFLGNGDGSFNHLPMSLGFYPIYGRIANLNNDGAQDLVIGDGVNAWTMLNSGDGSFAAPVKLNSTRRVVRLEVGHYDTDNLTDIFTISEYNTFCAFKNSGGGSFQEYVFSVEQPLSISGDNVFTTADFNQDGRGDFAIRVNRINAGIPVQEIAIYVQQQNDVFKLKKELIAQQDTQFDMTSADLNNDGSTELIDFYPNNGIEVFSCSFIAEPTGQAGPITILDRTDVKAKLGFAKGTGDGRIVLIRESTFPAELPEDDVFYSANSQFGLGANIGTDNFVVMTGNQTEVTITGLQAGTDYVATVFEYREDLQKLINNYLTSSYPTIAFKTKNAQTISFSAIDSKTEGDPPFLVVAKASSGLPVEFSSSSMNVVLTLGQVSIVGPGPVTITAAQGGNSDYMPAPNVSRTFCVNPVPPVITSKMSGTQLILTSSSGSNNQWILNGQPIPGAINTSFIAESGGNYVVKVDYGGCSALSDIVTEVEKIVRTVVSPNPASGILILHGIEVRVVTLTTSQGVQFQLPVDAHEGESRIDISGLSAGLYFLSAGNQRYIKVLISR